MGKHTASSRGDRTREPVQGRLRAAAVAILVLVGVLAAVGSGESKTSNTPVDSSGKTTNAVAHVGSTIAVDDGSDQKAQVTLDQVIDPAAPTNQFLTPDGDKRLVAIKLTVKNAGAKTLQDDVYLTSSVKGTDNQSYTPSIFPINGCTNFNNGSYSLAPNESVTGCATVEMPANVKPAQFNYEPTSFIGGTSGQWTIP